MWVDRMYISKNQNVTVIQIQPFHWGGGKHCPEPKCHLKSNFFILGGGQGAGGIHHSEPKCHLDLKPNFFISERGGGGPSPKSNLPSKKSIFQKKSSNSGGYIVKV